MNVCVSIFNHTVWSYLPHLVFILTTPETPKNIQSVSTIFILQKIMKTLNKTIYKQARTSTNNPTKLFTNKQLIVMLYEPCCICWGSVFFTAFYCTICTTMTLQIALNILKNPTWFRPAKKILANFFYPPKTLLSSQSIEIQSTTPYLGLITH